MNTAIIAKVLQIEKEDENWTVTFLTDKGLIVKRYEIVEHFFKEYESGKVKYKYREEFI